MGDVRERSVSPLRAKLLDIQECLEVRNQLERVDSCKAKDALLEEIELKLNPLPKFNASLQTSAKPLESRKADADSHNDDDESSLSWKPERREKSSLQFWLMSGALLLACSFAYNSCADHSTSKPPKEAQQK